MNLNRRFLYLAKVLDMVEKAMHPAKRKEDWRSLCCSAPMHGEPASNPSYPKLYGWCSKCRDTSEFVDIEAAS